MKTYIGVREEDGSASIYVEEDGARRRRLQNVCNSSMIGFEFGMRGAYSDGPADAAISMLSDATSPEVANRLYQDFKFEFIAQFPQTPAMAGVMGRSQGECWRISQDKIIQWVDGKSDRRLDDTFQVCGNCKLMSAYVLPISDRGKTVYVALCGLCNARGEYIRPDQWKGDAEECAVLRPSWPRAEKVPA